MRLDSWVVIVSNDYGEILHHHRPLPLTEATKIYCSYIKTYTEAIKNRPALRHYGMVGDYNSTWINNMLKRWNHNNLFVFNMLRNISANSFQSTLGKITIDMLHESRS